MQNKYCSPYSRLDRNFISFLLDTVSDKRYDTKESDFDVNLFNYLIGVGQ